MLVNHKHGFSFTHIPKCGGTWVRRALLEHLEGTEEITFRSDRHIGIHASPAQYDELKCLVSVREPLSLYVSLFNHICRNMAWEYAQEWVGFSTRNISNGTQLSDTIFRSPLCYERREVFKEWLPKIVNLDLNDDCWGSLCMNDSGSTTKYIQFMKDHRPNFGWCTYTLIYNTVREWKDFIKNKDINDFFEHTNANFILKQQSLAKDLTNFLMKHVGIDRETAFKIGQHDAMNVKGRDVSINEYYNDYYKHCDNLECLEWYTPELIQLVKEKESFMYQILEDEKVNEKFQYINC